MFKSITIAAAVAGLFVLGACEAASETTTGDAKAKVVATAKAAVKTDGDTLAAIRDKFPSLGADAIKPSPVDGWFEVLADEKIMYVSADGNYALSGDLINLETRVNLTEVRRNQTRRDMLSSFGDDEMVVFAPASAKHSITVFTDIDCGYCRKLHNEMDQLNDLGIEVRYMFFPRTGPNTASWEKASTVMCAKDRNSALTQAKQGQPLTPLECGSGELISAHYEMGRKVGLRGTPAIVTESGELIAGFRSADTLANQLEFSAKRAGLAD